MCSGYGDLTPNGLERGAAAGAAEILKKEEEKCNSKLKAIFSQFIIQMYLVSTGCVELYCRSFFFFSIFSQ